ncbi:MAG: type VI secretion system baseplate subunit TssE [Thermoanaerobaculia bacterium]
MSRVDNEIRITPSVLDRLLDDRPDESREAAASRQTSLRLLKQAVRRDLEWLLNARQLPGGISEELPETRRSLASYGLPDFAATNVKSPDEQHQLRQAVEDAVRTFEPRLEGVVVTLETLAETERSVRFRIEARLRVEPSPEPVVFDTMLQVGSGEFSVREK